MPAGSDSSRLPGRSGGCLCAGRRARPLLAARRCHLAALGLTLLFLGAALAACGSPPAAPEPGEGGATGHATRPAGERGLRTLPARAVPYLESRRRALTAADLAREAALPEMTGLLESWGYDAGVGRTFQGESRRLQTVESRTLRFLSAAGAASFAAYVRTHVARFFGGAGNPRALRSRGRRGWLVEAAPCACHLSTPAYLGVLTAGPRVTWLAISGPRATARALRALAARAP